MAAATGNAAGFVFYALLAGAMGAFASLFAKMTVDANESKGSLVHWLLCDVAAVDCSASSEQLISFATAVYIFRGLTLAAIFAANAIMWTAFSASLHLSPSSLVATLLSNSSNLFLTGILGNLLFGESLSWRWWLGATLVIVGGILVNDVDGAGQDKKSEKKEQ